MRLWRGDPSGGELTDYVVPAVEGEVVLDVIHRIQAGPAPDLACRWNCKAGKCGSCSAEINGLPRLMCMTRMDTLPEGEPVTVAPMKTFPIIRDLVTDVSFNYEVAKTVPAFKPGPEPEGGYRMAQIDVERGQEFRKCIECFMCQDVCHVIRDHEENKPKYAGPRFFIRFAELEMHPLDTNDRRELARSGAGLGMCNITKCCTEVCPEHIKITDNAIIPMKERVVDAHYDPVAWLGRKILQAHQEDRRRGVRRLSRRTTSRYRHAPLPLTRLGRGVQRRPGRARPHRRHLAAAGAGSLTASQGTFSVAQVVTDAPAGVGAGGAGARGGGAGALVRTVLTVDEGRITLTSDPDESLPTNVTIVLAYADALAIARGELDPAEALAAGRVRVRGELAVLVAGQSVLNAASAALGRTLTDLTDLD